MFFTHGVKISFKILIKWVMVVLQRLFVLNVFFITSHNLL